MTTIGADPARPFEGLDALTVPTLLPDRIYGILKSRILTCAFRPGMRLMEKELSEALHVSRTPLREALNRLALERLVELAPYRGYVVTPVRLQDIRNLLEFRRIVESETAALAAERATADDVEGLGKLARLHYEPGNRATYVGYLRDNNAFHRAVARCTRNERLEAAVTSVLELTQRPLYLGLDVGLDADAATAEHLVVVEYIQRKDSGRARQAMAEQILCGEKRIAAVVAALGDGEA